MRKNWKFLTFILFILVITSIITVIQYNETKNKYIAHFNEKQLLLAEQASLSFEREMSKLIGMVDVLANIPPVKRQDTSAVISAFERYIARVEGFKALLFIDDTLRFKMIFPEEAIEDCKKHFTILQDTLKIVFEKIKQSGSPFVFSTRIAPDEHLHLCVLAPVFNNNRFLGAVTGVIETDSLILDALMPIIKGKEEHAWILDNSGRLIFHPEHREMLFHSVNERDSSCFRCHSQQSIEYDALKGKKGVGISINKKTGKQLIGFSHADILNLNWIIFISSSYSTVNSTIFNQFRAFLVLFVLVSILLGSATILHFRNEAHTSRLMAQTSFLKKEKKLLEEKQQILSQYQTLIEQSPDPIFVANEEKITMVNHSFEKVFGYSKDQIEQGGLDLKDLCGNEERNKTNKEFRYWLQSDEKVIQLQSQLKTINNEIKDVVLSLSKINDNGNLKIQGVIHDITRIKELEKEKLEKEHLAQLGEISARLAHEIKNPLASMQAGIELLKSEFASKEEERIYFDKLIEEISRVDSILRNMLQFAREEKYEFKRCILSHLLREVIEVNKGLLITQQIQIEIDSEIDDDSCIIFADPNKIKQVIWNILNNSIQASSKNQKIRCSLKEEDGWIRLSIRDYGPGIPEEVKSHLFTPFRSTKTYGTGLGLVNSKRIIEKHNGRIEIKSLNPGTEVAIYLRKAEYES